MRLLPLLLLAACAADFVTVDRQPGLQGSWTQGSTSLDVSGSTATLAYAGRLFVFDHVDWLRGRLGEEEVALSGQGLRISADRERIAIREGSTVAAIPLASLPEGGRFAWADGTLKPR